MKYLLLFLFAVLSQGSEDVVDTDLGQVRGVVGDVYRAFKVFSISHLFSFTYLCSFRESHS